MPDVDDPFSITTEPAADQSGSQGGFLGSFSDFTLNGVYNGAFAKGPPDPLQPIDPVTSSGSNFLPNWRFVQSSNTNITASQVRDTSSPSGSNLRFTFASGASDDEAYVEQIVDMGGSRSRWSGNFIHPAVVNNGAVNFGAWASGQYLDADGNSVGPYISDLQAVGPGTTSIILLDMAPSSPPATARSLRIRLGVNRNGGPATDVGSVDFSDVRNDHALGRLILGDQSNPTAYRPGHIQATGGGLDISAGGGVSVNLSLTQFRVVLPGTAADSLYIQDGGLLIDTSVVPNTPSGTGTVIYPQTDGTLHAKNFSGLVSPLTFQSIRSLTGGSIAAGASRSDVFTWTTAFSDANYTVSATAGFNGADTARGCVCSVEAASASTVTIRTHNADSSPHQPQIMLIAVHD